MQNLVLIELKLVKNKEIFNYSSENAELILNKELIKQINI